MAKQILYILSGIFLMLGLNHLLNKEVQKFRVETGMITIQPSCDPAHNNPPVFARQSDKYKQAAKDETHRYKPDEGILSNVSQCRGLTFSRTPKFNTAAASLLNLTLLSYRSSDRNQHAFSPNIDFIRYSYRYYVYTLGRMLI